MRAGNGHASRSNPARNPAARFKRWPADAHARGPGRHPRSSTRLRALSAKTLGVLAVVGLVVAFSLSSTLVKRAETPGVLVAFWRMVTVSVVWNVAALEHGPAGDAARRAPGARAGRLLRPEPGGVLRGRDAQQRRQRRADRVARAVPDRAGRRVAVRRVHQSAGAGVRAWSPSAASRSCCSARRPNGDASLEGNVFGVARDAAARRLRRVDRHFRRDMDVTTFMATICPIAAVAVLPLAIAHGDVFGMSAHGLDVHADPHASPAGSRPRGCSSTRRRRSRSARSAIAQVAQPALAVVWSFLLLGEVINGRQAAGIAIVMGGLLAFVVLHQRGDRSGRAR